MERCQFGQRVKVTNGACLSAGERGIVVDERWELGTTRDLNKQTVKVLLDGAKRPTEFDPGDLEMVPVRIAEGRVDDQGFLMEGPWAGPVTAFMRVGKEYRGKFIRVTAEELDPPADYVDAAGT